MENTFSTPARPIRERMDSLRAFDDANSKLLQELVKDPEGNSPTGKDQYELQALIDQKVPQEWQQFRASIAGKLRYAEPQKARQLLEEATKKVQHEKPDETVSDYVLIPLNAYVKALQQAAVMTR